jgi:glutamate synthase domain-containing protein 2
MLWIALVVLGLALWVACDVLQRRHAIIHNFPVIGHFRYWLEAVGPELRQYIVTSNNEERPFSRDERAWVYASAKRQNNYCGFGTDNDLEGSPNYLIIQHETLPAPSASRVGEPDWPLPCAKVLGGARRRRRAFRPASLVNVSAMSFGSLSGSAVEAVNRGAALAGCLQNTGEGGISVHHAHGGELIWQIGTGYFGCRDADGRFSLERLCEQVERHPVRALEIKLSQGAKPGHGGVLPRAKISEEIAAMRGIPRDRDCISPPWHSAFAGVDGLLDFVELLAERTGLPVGIKSAVGEPHFWRELAGIMGREERGVDFITIDGGEGGTGAAPPAFADHVSLPFRTGFARVYRELAEHGVDSRVVLIGSGRLGFGERALCAMAMGADMINVAREAMLAIGCIQAQRCHTGHCPAGVATQNRWLMRGLDPTHKGPRLANYVVTLRKELLQLARVCGVPHPSLITPDHCEIIDERFGSSTARELFELGDHGAWGLPSSEQQAELLEWINRSSAA